MALARSSLPWCPQGSCSSRASKAAPSILLHPGISSPLQSGPGDSERQQQWFCLAGTEARERHRSAALNRVHLALSAPRHMRSPIKLSWRSPRRQS